MHFYSILSIVEIQKCILDQINGFESDYLDLMDQEILTTIVTDFFLLPPEFRNAVQKCLNEIEDFECEKVYGRGECEKCGVIKVKKCDYGFIRIDCGICAKECPPETMSDAGGLMCLKPKIKPRKVFYDKESCLKDFSGKTCEKVSDFMYLHPCDINFKPMANLMCEYRCPKSQGWNEEGIYCVPPTMEYESWYLQLKPTRKKYNVQIGAFE